VSDPAQQTAAPASLVATVLDEESRRQEAQAEHAQQVVLPDDMLPGVGAEPVSLRQALRENGVRTAVAVGFLNFILVFDSIALSVLAPDIRSSLHISNAALGVIGGAFGILFFLGSVPISALADRVPRKVVAATAMTAWSIVVSVTGAVTSGFQLFLARLGAGLSQSYALPVNGPLLMDTYPIGARGKIFALDGSFQMAGLAISPLFAGGIASLAGGHDGWRWVFISMGMLGAVVTLGALTIREPRRGRQEMRAVLGAELDEDTSELPISLSVAFERLKKIQTFYFFLIGIAALGFALFSSNLFINLYLRDHFHLSAFERGIFASGTVLPAFLSVAIAGRRSDSLFRQSPPKAMVLIGALISLFGMFLVVGLYLPEIWMFGVLMGVSLAFSRAAFAILPAVVSTIIPYRLRSRGLALLGIYLFLFGSFFGAVLTGLLSDSVGDRAALTIVVLPATLVGGALIAYGARYVRRDISLVVEELTEEQEEQQRLAQAGARIPVLQVRNLDFSYGKVQVLFDVALEVHQGEVLALLGTNGAGKSTILRVVSGLGVPTRGVVRLNGRTITYADPELRAKVGVVSLAGGKATFSALSVEENLRMAGFRYARHEADERIARVLEVFPQLRDRMHEPAGDLSGGQQQMLALAMALLHDPEILLIDELSLGLSPIVVQELLGVVERLRERGITMVIVEQSLNVALAFADRAIFLEKGQIRFEGPARELAERDDLARAVFLGAEHG
jgi:ABC-type branched-subunit amino acid transport system ATPase component/predicted MFS family arabinose efflux permease